MRITRKHLEAKVSIVNRMLGFDPDGGANGGYNHKGFLTLSGAYGGYDVHQYIGESGAVNSLMGAHYPAKEASQFLSGMITALRLEK